MVNLLVLGYKFNLKVIDKLPTVLLQNCINTVDEHLGILVPPIPTRIVDTIEM
jgi:hypothetical protein